MKTLRQWLMMMVSASFSLFSNDAMDTIFLLLYSEVKQRHVKCGTLKAAGED